MKYQDKKRFKDLTSEEIHSFQTKVAGLLKWAIPYLIACVVVDVICIRMRHTVHGTLVARDFIFAVILDVVIIYWSRIMWRNRQVRKEYKDEIKEHKRNRREKLRAQFRKKQ